MIYEFNEFPVSEKTYDCAIIGAGPAGISCAKRLAEIGFRCIVLEGGGRSLSDQSQSVYDGKTVGDPYLPLVSSRLRYFGGTSGHWAGWSRPLDAIDFNRGYLDPVYSWPIDKYDLDPYLIDALNHIDLSGVFADEVYDDEFGINEIEFKFSPPTRFGDKYHDAFAQSDKLDLVLNANFLRFIGSPQRPGYDAARLAGYNGKEENVSARFFVLAAGGIENSRLLLWQRRVQESSILKESLPIGQYWMEHPHATVGDGIADIDFNSGTRYFSLTKGIQQDFGILNAGLRLSGMPYEGTKRVIADLMCVAPKVGKRLAGLAGKRLVCGMSIRAAWEQAPDVSNRVELNNSELDRFGMPRPILHWRLTDLDRKTIKYTLGQLGDMFKRKDIGRVRIADWLASDDHIPSSDEIGGYHHMGGTRMGTDASISVVDSNAKVHGVDNLYVAGSSVFPTGGHANPTLTIIQLALRLADHLGSIR